MSLRALSWLPLLSLPMLLAGCDETRADEGAAASTGAPSIRALTGPRPTGRARAPQTVASSAAPTPPAPSESARASIDASSSVPSSSSSAAAAAPSSERRPGLWIWELSKNAPDAERAATICAELGVRRVFIKGNNGSDGARWQKNASRDNLRRFTERGIEVWLFGYFYAPDVPDADGKTWGTLAEQVEAAMRVAGAPEVTGFIVDAEEEFKDRAEEATTLCRSLRARLGGKKLGYTSYGWLSPHKRFPFKAFDRACSDVFLPQVYSTFGWPGGTEGSLTRMRKERDDLGLKAPVWPVQSNERDPAASELTRFFELAGPDASVFYLHPEGSPQNEKLRSVLRR